MTPQFINAMLTNIFHVLKTLAPHQNVLDGNQENLLQWIQNVGSLA
jgi:hypothetical protein